MEICGDNRFEIIAKAKAHLLDATNIDTAEDEMNVLDSFLYRCWQMGWLDRYDEQTEPKRGEWIDTSNKIHYKCSVCDYRAPMIWEDYEVAEWLSDFCPNCGADMREREGE